jgi:hypothetical protein
MAAEGTNLPSGDCGLLRSGLVREGLVSLGDWSTERARSRRRSRARSLVLELEWTGHHSGYLS